MKVILSVLIACLSVVYSYSETSVWKISDGNNTAYLGGTIHILRESDYPLPDAFNNAFKKSDILVFESPSTAIDLLYGEKFKLLLDDCVKFNEMNNSEKIKRYIDLAIKFQTLVQKHKSVNEALSGVMPIEGLTNSEVDILVQVFYIIQEIQSMSDDEEIYSYNTAAELLLPKIEDNKEFLGIFMNPDYQLLEVILDDDTFGIVKNTCNKYNISISEVIYLNPYIAHSFLLYQILSQFCKADGVDAYFEKKAVEYGKKIEYLESAEIVLPLLVNSANVYGNSYYSLLYRGMDDEDQIKDSFERMVNSWKNGIYDTSLMASDEYDMENFPLVYEAIIKNRNNAWLPIIEDYLQTSSEVFILVGNGHMYGPDGLLMQLHEKGYLIEQL